MAVPSKRCLSEVVFKKGDRYGRLLPEIGKFLTELTAYGDAQRANNLKASEPSVFDGKTVVMSVEDYLFRLSKYGNVGGEVFVMMLIFIKRLLDHTDLLAHSYVIHRMMFTAFVLATKYHEEDLYNNTHYSQIGGIVRGELVRLELFFVKVIDFDLFISRDEFDGVVAGLAASAAKRCA
eukprot:TRINITY_DN27707_c0_g1_i2.p1 TRINITY_DN27707_c0_g1~~TRINITY_DN27707_c0_g1_i2.p1  ORF type:complete len:179 (+),score=23.95 TRINITY_DN27707_c0_g1_i2:74-610(+)